MVISYMCHIVYINNADIKEQIYNICSLHDDIVSYCVQLLFQKLVVAFLACFHTHLVHTIFQIFLLTSPLTFTNTYSMQGTGSLYIYIYIACIAAIAIKCDPVMIRRRYNANIYKPTISVNAYSLYFAFTK